MSVKIFVGLSFYTDNSFAKNIQNFRSRFDEKYVTNPILHLAIVPPFEIETNQVQQLSQELIEELDSFYFENLSHHRLQFTGLGVHEYKKSKLLYLNPIFDEELLYCQESLFSICQSYITDREKKLKESGKTFLTIGRFQDSFLLHQAIEEAKKDFPEFTSLSFKAISLFSKNNGVWYQEADLITFERPDQKFLQNSLVSL